MPGHDAGDKGRTVSPLAAPLRALIAFALPPRCPACGQVTPADHRFCGACWSQLRFLGEPACAACGVPFDHHRGADARCAPCIAQPPPHDGVRAAVAYGDTARAVVLRLKYGRRLAHATTMATLIARHMPADATLIVPVPLYRWRLWSRGFNQALLIAQGLGNRTGVAVSADILLRIKGGGSLRGRGRAARRKTVAGVFAVAPDAQHTLTGRHVVLVDDVHTSGATAEAAARVLKRGGAARVTLLCWARVLPGDTDEASDPSWPD